MTTAERRRRVKMLHGTGSYSVQQLADEFGVHRKTIQTDLRMPETVSNRKDSPKISSAATARIVELLQQEIDRGRPLADIIQQAGLQYRSLYRLLNETPDRMHFALADEIVTKLWSPLKWISEDALSDWYLGERGWWEAAA